MPQREGEEMQAMLAKFKEEMKKDMLELVEKALSAKAAAPPAPPVAAAAQGDGDERARVLQGQGEALEKAVAELKSSQQIRQRNLFAEFGRLQEAKATILKQAMRIEELESQYFRTPVKLSLAGELPLPVPMPMPVGVLFSAGGGGAPGRP